LAQDLSEIVAVCRRHGVPLVIDEAHGAHFHWLPEGGPQSALAAGADMAIQSWHKTLGSLVGSAMFHVGRKSPGTPTRVQDALNFLQTTSSSLLLLASLDVTRRRLARDGKQLYAEAVCRVRDLEDELERLPGIRVLRPENDSRLAGHRRDPM